MLNAATVTSALLAAALLAFCLDAPARAQQETDADKAGQTERVIIGDAPKRSRIHALLSRLFGKPKTETLATTGSEVVTIPKSKIGLLEKRLKQVGAKLTRLGENWNHILTRRRPDAPLTPEQKSAVDKASNSPATMGVGVLQMPDAAIAELALTRFEQSVGTKGRAGPQDDPYAKVFLPLGDGHIRLVRTRTAVLTPGGVTWVGETEETGERAVLMLWKDGHLSGYFGYKGRIYTVNHAGGVVHTMAEIDPTRLPPDHAPDPAQRNPSVAPASPTVLPPPPPEPEVPAFSDAERQALEAKTIVIDVMLLYTPRVVANYIRNPVDLSALAIEQANQTLRNSALGNISLRLVDSQLIDYDEAGADLFDHLYRMVDGVGVFKDLKKLRDAKRADIVGLVLDSPTGCGQSTRVGADADDAYFVVHHACAAITYSIAHEIGHILGARHDRIMDANDKPFPFAHGFINGSKWRDMMSYQEGCAGCPRIPYWSNPRVMYRGEPTGTPASDNARVILEQAERVSQFR